MTDTTIVNTPPAPAGDIAGSVVMLAATAVVLVGGFLLYRTYGLPATSATPTVERAQINVTVPMPNTDGNTVEPISVTQ